jgi:hypothetical protein
MQPRVTWVVALASAMAVAVAVLAVWVVRPDEEPQRPRVSDAVDQPTSPAPQTVAPSAPSPSPSPRDRCDSVERAFAPRAITVPGLTTATPVVTPPRDANGIPGVPPLTEAGKLVFAWDREQGTRPGGQKGNVLLNAHTWPDGSALGNHLLAGLQSGDRLVVHGADARLCYRVTERVEVLAEQGLPRYYRKDGPSQLAIVVCSGRRLGPGIWEKRTVWFASPSV